MEGIRHNQPVSHPIPFFGRLDSAIAATVAMNPSSTEFIPERGWSRHISAADLCSRLINYFSLPTPPHNWFDESERPLAPLGLRYASNLVHLDIIPRATKWIQDVDSGAFRKLAESDAWVFSDALTLAHSVQLVILSGTVCKFHYMDTWVKERAATYGWKFIEDRNRLGRPGCGFHKLMKGNREVGVFFTSVSRNARTQEKRLLYAKNILNAEKELRRYLA